MPVVPAFLLRRLYEKGSLENLDVGWRFTLRNGLGSGYALALAPIELDGQPIPHAAASFNKNGETVAFSDVSAENTFGLPMHEKIVINVKGTQLEKGSHNVRMGFTVPGFGELHFDFTDEV